MKASLHYVVRNLGRRRTRTVLGILGIFLTLSFLTTIQIGLESVSSSYTDLAALQAGKADLIITAEGGNLLRPEGFPDGEAREKLKRNPHLLGLASRLTGTVQARFGPTEHYAVLLGLDPAQERKLAISGLTPDPALRDGTCALSRTFAKKLNARQGADVVVHSPVSGEELTLRVTTIVERQLILPQEVKDYIVVNELAARTLLNEPFMVHALAGAFRNPTQYYDARDLNASVRQLKVAGSAIAADLGPGYDIRLPKASAIATFQNFTAPIRAFFGVFALLALSITALLIYSITSVAVEERIREYAILRTMGGKRRDIIRLVLGESLLLCLAGVIPGLFAGVVFARVGVKIVERLMRAEGNAIALQISPSTLWLALLAGVLLSFGSALFPALQAVRWRIVDALNPFRRGQISEPQSSPDTNRPLLLIGVALSALSVVVFFVLPTAFLSGDPSLIGTVVLCLLVTILLGFTLVAVGALPFVERIVMTVIGRLLGPVAEMAGRNLSRNRRRNTTTAVMFILSVACVIFIASLAALFSRTSMAMVEHFNGADLQIQADALAANSVKDDLVRLDGVTAVSEVKYLRSRSQGGIAYDVVVSDLVGMKQLWIVPYGIDAELAGVLYLDRIHYAEGGPEDLARLATENRSIPRARVAAKSDSTMVVVPSEPALGSETNAATRKIDEIQPLILSLSAARFLQVERGDLVRLSFRLGAARTDARYRIAAICGAMPGFENFHSRVALAVGSGVLMPLSSFQAMTEAAPTEAFRSRFFVKTSGNDAVQTRVAQQIRDDFDLRYRFGVKSTVERKNEARKLYWATQVLFALLLSVVIVIAVFALIASMATAAIERRWEVGVLKALGLRRGHLFRLFLGETVALTLSSGLVGGAIGFSLAYLFVVQAAALIEVPVVFTMPYITFIVTFAVSLLAGALAAYVPTRRLLHRSAAEILRLDT